jgi:hypothetical protein
MGALEQQIDQRLRHGQRVFSGREMVRSLKQSPEAFEAAARRLKRKHRLASPHRGFFLILSPEDQAYGAPDPIRWIAPLMKHLGVDYRISLLRAAAHHGSSHQAAMVFQVIAPKQLRPIEIGRHRIQFLYQAPEDFAAVNQDQYLVQIKSESGFAKAAGIELLLLDSVRYMHRASGLNGVAQMVHDIGRKADPRKLAKLAAVYEGTAVRRLGYLFDRFGMGRQAEALVRFAKGAKSMKALDPGVKPLPGVARVYEEDPRWKLVLNRPVELDA